MKADQYKDFHKDVTKDIPEYKIIINRPMNFNEINQNLRQNKYQYVEQYLDDIQLIFDNCLNYNGPDNLFTLSAIDIEKEYINLLMNSKVIRVSIQYVSIEQKKNRKHEPMLIDNQNIETIPDITE